MPPKKGSKRKINEKHSDGKESKSTKATVEMQQKFATSFFNRPCLELAKDLLGKILVCKMDKETVQKGYIVEVEIYPGGEDKGSATYNGRRTEANEPLYMAPGTAYVYLTYGMYHCFNISAQEPGAGVFIRALQPLDGIEEMRNRRLKKMQSNRVLKEDALCNGPSKLCISMGIDKETINKADLSSSQLIWIEDDGRFVIDKIVECKRIGIDRAGKEWSQKPWRFYVYDNVNVSVRDKVAEEKLFCK